MAKFMQSLLGRLGGGAREAEAGEAVLVGVCGKHPCEEDHFSDYPPGAVRMPDLMRRIYTEGIKANIESGAWKQLDAARRVAAFDHLLLYSEGRDAVVGRLWPSRDRVGRADYPIIYCAELRGVEMRHAVNTAWPALQQLETRCRAAQARAIIRAELAGAQDRISAAVAADPNGAANDALDALIDCPQLGPQQRGLHRILYRIENEAPTYLRAKARGGDVTPTLHLRVPLCASSPEQGVYGWSAFFRGVLAPHVPLLVCMPANQHWVDVVIGPAIAEQVYFLMSSAETLTSEVPYPLDAPFANRARQWLADARPARPAVQPPAPPRAAVRPPPLPRSAGT